MNAALVFLSTLLLDIVWAHYIKATSGNRSLSAATYSALLVLLGGFNAWTIAQDLRFVVPAALGAFVGTFVAVRS